jgi:hypothetical protein
MTYEFQRRNKAAELAAYEAERIFLMISGAFGSSSIADIDAAIELAAGRMDAAMPTAGDPSLCPLSIGAS